MVRHLTLLQLDPISAVAPSVDLVAWSRLGSSCSPSDLRAALDDHRLVELRAMVRPAEDIALYRADMAVWPGTGELKDWQEFRRDWVLANDRCRRQILERLRDAGPLPSRQLPDTCEEPWGSTGWTNNKNVTQLLDLMAQRGEVAVAGRKGRDRLWDLAERVYPDGPVLPVAEAERERDRRRLRALGIARTRGPEWQVEPAVVSEAGERSRSRACGGTAPRSCSSSTTSWRCNKPAAKRRWGHFALPILHGDRLVGKLDATADRKGGVFPVNAVYQDVPFTKAMAAAVDQEIADLARWLELDVRRTG